MSTGWAGHNRQLERTDGEKSRPPPRSLAILELDQGSRYFLEHGGLHDVIRNRPDQTDFQLGLSSKFDIIFQSVQFTQFSTDFCSLDLLSMFLFVGEEKRRQGTGHHLRHCSQVPSLLPHTAAPSSIATPFGAWGSGGRKLRNAD